MFLFPKKCIQHFQNAHQTKRPEEFVDYISLAIPLGADMDDPAKDAVLMTKIGATQINGHRNRSSEIEYAMRNAATETRFTFKRLQLTRGSHWILRREKKEESE